MDVLKLGPQARVSRTHPQLMVLLLLIPQNPAKVLKQSTTHSSVKTLSRFNTMAVYTSFAMIGAGSLGSFITAELLKKDVSVKVLTRDDSKVRLTPVSQIIYTS
jgi:hypothetical protein